jgi:hypothetical protein
VNVKVKVNKHYTMKTYWWLEVQRHAFLTSVLQGGEWSASRPGRFTAGERALGIHWIGGWVGHGSGLDVVEKPGSLVHKSTDIKFDISDWTKRILTEWREMRFMIEMNRWEAMDWGKVYRKTVLIYLKSDVGSTKKHCGYKHCELLLFALTYHCVLSGGNNVI